MNEPNRELDMLNENNLPSAPKKMLCERCGGTGVVEEVTKK
jgi:hypothetical protein